MSWTFWLGFLLVLAAVLLAPFSSANPSGSSDWVEYYGDYELPTDSKDDVASDYFLDVNDFTPRPYPWWW